MKTFFFGTILVVAGVIMLLFKISLLMSFLVLFLGYGLQCSAFHRLKRKNGFLENLINEYLETHSALEQAQKESGTDLKRSDWKKDDEPRCSWPPEQEKKDESVVGCRP